MRRWANPGLAAAAIAATVVAAGSISVAESTGEGLIKYRQSVMSAVGGHTGAIARIVRGEAEHDAHLAAHAQALNDLALMIPDAFAEPGADAETRALPVVWEDHDAFLEKAEDLHAATTALAAAAESGDPEAVAEAFGPVGSACQACHEVNRSD